jgi:hypothetical protein
MGVYLASNESEYTWRSFLPSPTLLPLDTQRYSRVFDPIAKQSVLETTKETFLAQYS